MPYDLFHEPVETGSSHATVAKTPPTAAGRLTQATKDLFYIVAEYQERGNRVLGGGRRSASYLDEALIREKWVEAAKDGRKADTAELAQALRLAGVLAVLGTAPNELRQNSGNELDDDYLVLARSQAFDAYRDVAEYCARQHQVSLMTPSEPENGREWKKYTFPTKGNIISFNEQAWKTQIPNAQILPKIDSQSVKGIDAEALVPMMGLYLARLQEAAREVVEQSDRKGWEGVTSNMQHAINRLVPRTGFNMAYAGSSRFA